MTGKADPIEIMIDPAPARWGLRRGEFALEGASTLRRELGLPSTGVVMSGHQPGFWHPGILAKWLAMLAGAKAAAMSSAWLVVDHDAVNPMSVRVPVRRDDGSLGTETVDFSGGGHLAGMPACAMRAVTARSPALRSGVAALPSVEGGLVAMRSALERHSGAGSAAEQAALAVADLVHSAALEAMRRPAVIFSSRLGSTAVFRGLVGRMLEDARACVVSHNEAVRAHAGGGVRELEIGEGRIELPVWRLEGARRHAVYAEEARGLMERAGVVLAPRALLMTLMLRLAACDVFVHGVGGGGGVATGRGAGEVGVEREGYDRVMEDWAARWLGGEAVLAPAVTVSATLRLDFGGLEMVLPEEAARATWRAWHARNDPGLLGDSGAAARKREIAAQIAGLARRTRERRVLFDEMNSIVGAVRQSRAGEIEVLDARAEEARVASRETLVRADRTWAFPLHGEAPLRMLGAAISARFERGGSR